MKVTSKKLCKSNKVRDRSTGRCRKRKSPKKSVRTCKSNEVRDLSTGRCRKRLNSKKLSANAYTPSNGTHPHTYNPQTHFYRPSKSVKPVKTIKKKNSKEKMDMFEIWKRFFK
jgi:hypothetical protein